MTKDDFAKWTKNGNFTMSQDRILEVTNHIAEGVHRAYTKAEASQAVTYWSLSEFLARQKEQGFQDRQLGVLLKMLVKLTRRNRNLLRAKLVAHPKKRLRV